MWELFNSFWYFWTTNTCRETVGITASPSSRSLVSSAVRLSAALKTASGQCYLTASAVNSWPPIRGPDGPKRGRCLHTPESSQRIPRTAGNRKPEELTCRAHLWNASSAHRTERWSARSLWRRCHCRRASSGRRRSRSPPGISHCPWTPLRGRRRKKHRAVRACLCWPITSCQQLLATCDPILGLNYVIVCRSSRLTC